MLQAIEIPPSLPRPQRVSGDPPRPPVRTDGRLLRGLAIALPISLGLWGLVLYASFLLLR